MNKYTVGSLSEALCNPPPVLNHPLSSTGVVDVDHVMSFSALSLLLLLVASTTCVCASSSS